MVFIGYFEIFNDVLKLAAYESNGIRLLDFF